MTGTVTAGAAPQPLDRDTAALAKGGRQNFGGFLLRLAARIPFLLIAGRLYGAESLGRFASALVVVELAAMLASLGEKRGLAQRLSEADEAHPANLVWEVIFLALALSLGAAALLWVFPAPLFPSGEYGSLDRLIVLANRPSFVRSVIEVKLPRPRHYSMLSSPEAYAYKREAMAILHEEAMKNFRSSATSQDFIEAFSKRVE